MVDTEIAIDEPPRAEVLLEISTFNLPPHGDILVLGKKCPLGPEGAQKMLDSVAPGVFERVDAVGIGREYGKVDALFVKNHLFLRVDRKKLVGLITAEVEPIMGPECMLAVQCDIKLTVRRML